MQPYQSKEKLDRLMVALQERYKGTPYTPPQIDEIQPGKIYASRHTNGGWYRTSVIKVIHDGSISVFYCDFGYYGNLTRQQLIPLDAEFMELPYQAIKAKLVGELQKEICSLKKIHNSSILCGNRKVQKRLFKAEFLVVYSYFYVF